ncbi:MAG: hypothetical protein HY656_09495 [Acidobacteria bacterium]|nr:hypothetical protein [Acidobacteriota bacterium]
MPQCFHLDADGRRCPEEAEDGQAFCLWHEAASGLRPPLVEAGVARRLFRLAALILLALFLVPLLVQGYRVLRALVN